MYPQGSVRLGTVVRPFTGEEGFDLDMVGRRNIQKASTTQEKLKEEVGDALAEYLGANKGVPGAPHSCTPSRRCWTLPYPVEFHMDVRPAIPDADAGPTGILLTDKRLTRWLPSDPIAYANWFREKMATEFSKRKTALAAEARKSIEQVPERKRLLDAHYANAIPLDLLKSEQSRIATEMANAGGASMRLTRSSGSSSPTSARPSI